MLPLIHGQQVNLEASRVIGQLHIIPQGDFWSRQLRPEACQFSREKSRWNWPHQGITRRFVAHHCLCGATVSSETSAALPSVIKLPARLAYWATRKKSSVVPFRLDVVCQMNSLHTPL